MSDLDFDVEDLLKNPTASPSLSGAAGQQDDNNDDDSQDDSDDNAQSEVDEDNESSDDAVSDDDSDDSSGQNDDYEDNNDGNDDADSSDDSDAANDSFQEDLEDDEGNGANENEESNDGIHLKDDFIKKVVDYYEKFGNLQPFLEATQVDYDKVKDIDLLRANFDKENSDLSEKTRDKLFQKELQKYNLDSFEEDEQEIGQALLKRDADRLRKTLKEQQKEFLNSITPTQTPQQPSQEEIEKQRAKERKLVETEVNKVVKDNLIKLEVNGDSLNYQLTDTTKVIDYAVDSAKFLSTFTKNGTIDWNKWTKVVAFAENPEAFIGEMIKHGKSLGKKSLEAELKNSTLEKKSKDVVKTSDAIHPLDDIDAFLGELSRKK